MIVNLKDSWIVQLHNNLLAGKEKVNPRDITFFNIDMIEQAARHTVLHMKDCGQCQANKEELLALSREFPEMLATISGRRDFTNRLDRVLKHLRQVHGVYPKGYFTGVYTILGVTIGGLVGWLIARLDLLSMYAAMITFLGIGLIVGWVWGQVKDRQIAKNGKRLDLLDAGKEN